jgi:hypothetical protein
VIFPDTILPPEMPLAEAVLVSRTLLELDIASEWAARLSDDAALAIAQGSLPIEV